MDVALHRVRDIVFSKVVCLGNSNYSLTIEVACYNHYDNNEKDVSYDHITLFADNEQVLKQMGNK